MLYIALDPKPPCPAIQSEIKCSSQATNVVLESIVFPQLHWAGQGEGQ